MSELLITCMSTKKTSDGSADIHFNIYLILKGLGLKYYHGFEKLQITNYEAAVQCLVATASIL